MEVQHPIQHTPATFSAFLPVEESLRAGRIGTLEYVRGEYGMRRQVFADYYKAITDTDRVRSPHLLFANSGDSIEEILNFTALWGPLRPNRLNEDLLLIAFENEATPENQFAFFVQDWRASRKRFAEAVQTVSSNRVETLSTLLPYRQPQMGPVKNGGLYPYIEAGSPIEFLERLWAGEGGMRKDEVRPTAQRWGFFFTEKGGPKYRLIFEAVSLLDAFWHMLFLDLTLRRPMIRTCNNAKCGRQYVAGRSDQKYCRPECARNAANLAYYHRKGAMARRKKPRERSSKGGADDLSRLSWR